MHWENVFKPPAGIGMKAWLVQDSGAHSISACNRSGTLKKITLYADDAAFVFQNPSSYTALRSIVTNFATVSGYKINKSKSTMMGINLSPPEVEQDQSGSLV